MAGGRFMTTCTPKYSDMYKVIAPFGTTLDCDMWRGAFWHPPDGTIELRIDAAGCNKANGKGQSAAASVRVGLSRIWKKKPERSG